MDYVKHIEKVDLWDKIDTEETPCMSIFHPINQTADCAILIFPGGGYQCLAPHESKPYAEFFAANGMLSAVVDYRFFPHSFPIPLQDAQRAIQLLRYNASKYGIDKNKIAVMGSSAGAHLAATLSTYRELITDCNDEISQESIIPNAQILCYGVLTLVHPYAHKNSAVRFLGERKDELENNLSPILIADNKTPQAFLWHTLSDNVVFVENSLDYVKRLHQVGVKAELHIFPDGEHGLGLSIENTPMHIHNSQWKALLLNWLTYIHFVIK